MASSILDYKKNRDLIYLSYKRKKYWWEAVNWFNVNSKIIKYKNFIQSDVRVVYFPNYAANPYQNIMYSSLNSDKKEKGTEIIDDLCFLSMAKKRIFHIHWLKEIFVGCDSEEKAKLCYEGFLDELKIYIGIGCKIIWTIHNKVDHDQPDFISKYLIELMKHLCDVTYKIHVHSLNSIGIMEEFLGVSFKDKAYYLEHPLYPVEYKYKKTVIPEMKGRKFENYLLSLGMIRPYKGVAQLLSAYESALRSNKNIKLVVAGRCLDPAVDDFSKTMVNKYPGNFVYINRSLSDEEVHYLYANCLVSVLTYQKILISGSYYMASTHKKPSICPNIGMFTEMVNEENGFLYDQSIPGLKEVINRIANLPKEQINEIGKRSYEKCSNSYEKFSEKYLELIRGS
ncbi:glycosyltransferase [Shewanella saliphila]|uniref:Peptidase M14 n=1 Tax=Shewanella saliphila TaxID=2282698 RepID=A0ABQ2Q6D8_9GAMM|nr:glycosyltransferase [Shewanella saliphila]MCL1101354.1 glycosyltransferase [Shewanella saliphila]GGP50335.1 peptidase M14 [Shewanella saliphila]